MGLPPLAVKGHSRRRTRRGGPLKLRAQWYYAIAVHAPFGNG